ncbi:MAG: hypothetical protein RBU37_09985 [Myxococcota bacterium]|jgi:hypothetical protein|nr:hypothetical protein [Myxococcota bacterium]
MEKQKPRLYEVLAIEQEKKGYAERARSEVVDTFRSRQAQFTGMRRTFKPFMVDEGKGEVAGERLEAETRLVLTVPEVLNQTLALIGPALDISYQIDEANTQARADIEIEGVVIAEQVPATYLLQLEKRLRELRAAFKEIPTLDPVRLWQEDAAADKRHVFRAEPVVTIRKQRTRKYNVMYEATEEHPAQIDIVEVDEAVGEIRSYDWTGMIAPGRKAALLEQADKLIEAVKAARSRANAVEVDTNKKLADKLFAFMMQPLKG